MKNFGIVIGLAVLLYACDKSADDLTEKKLDAETIEIVNELVMTEALEEDINASINKAIVIAERSNEKSAKVESECFSVTVKPIIGGYPKTITIDFGDGCEGSYGFVRSGKIAVSLSDTMQAPGATYTVTFDQFAIEGYTFEGSIAFENTGTASVPSFYEDLDLTMTTSGGVLIEKSKTVNRYWLEGASTNEVTDDVYSIEGSAEVSVGTDRSYTYEIISPLIISPSCDIIKEGILEITTSKSDTTITVDFGTGDCDRIAKITKGSLGQDVTLN